MKQTFNYREIDFWLEQDKKTITLDGIKYILCASTWNNDEKHYLDVSLEVKNKSLPMYRKEREKLGDDWSFDLLESSELLIKTILALDKEKEFLAITNDKKEFDLIK